MSGVAEPSGRRSAGDVVVMWEARAVPDQCDALVDWALAISTDDAEVFRSDGPEPRVVIIQRAGQELPEPPDALVARPPHAWNFARVSGPRVDDDH